MVDQQGQSAGNADQLLATPIHGDAGRPATTANRRRQSTGYGLIGDACAHKQAD